MNEVLTCYSCGAELGKCDRDVRSLASTHIGIVIVRGSACKICVDSDPYLQQDRWDKKD